MIDDRTLEPEEDVDESYLDTPHLGTPPDDAPEDAFRNTHRQSVKKRPKQPDTDLSVESVGDG